MAKQPLVNQGLLIIETSRSYSDTPILVQFLWTSDKPDTGNSTWQHTPTRDWYPCHRWDSNPQYQQRTVADPVFRPRCYWDRPCYENTGLSISLFIYKWKASL